MTILVTGGAGYIGSHTCLELLNSGFDVIVADNFSNSKYESLLRVQEITGKDIIYYKVDLLDQAMLESIFVENSIEAVVHFAGLKAVGESVKNPIKYYQNNITGTINLCKIMKKYSVKNLVFSSSATVYAMQSNSPITEDFALGATNPYGHTKVIIERILHDLYHSDNEWSVSLLRYFNPIGAHSSGRIGEDPIGIPNNLMPYITQVAVGKLKELSVFGNDYPTNDGTGVRDYIHVVDLAKGHLSALKKVISTDGINAYNLGTGRGHSVLEVLNTFEKVSGKVIPYEILSRRLGDVPICYSDPTKAYEELGWSAQRGIEEMCEDAWRWQQNNPDGYLK